MYFVVVFFLSDRPPPRSNRTYTLFPDTPLFRSLRRLASGAPLMPWRPADDHRPRPRPRRDPWLRRPRASQPRRGIADAGAGGRCRGRLSARGGDDRRLRERAPPRRPAGAFLRCLGPEIGSAAGWERVLRFG